MPLRGAEALRRVRGAGRLRVVPGGEALSQFDYRNKNCGTNIVMSIVQLSRFQIDLRSSLRAPSECPRDTRALFRDQLFSEKRNDWNREVALGS
jgi:hypothetical protein